MGLIKVLKFIINHPISSHSKISSVARFFWWQFRCKITARPYIHTFTTNSKLIISKGMTGATGNLYCGLHEYKEMLFLLHYLRIDELLIDIGANIGSFTVLASAEIKANTYCFEPVPATFKQLTENIVLNKVEHKVQSYNIGIASKKGELFFTNEYDSSMNHVVYDADKSNDLVRINVETLDSILINANPTLLKIDVEGFEFEVLNGALSVLRNQSLKAIIIELNNSGLQYGFKDEEIDQRLNSFGFEPYTYNPFSRQLLKAKLHDSDNLIYIRDVETVMNKLQSAPKFKILNTEI